MSTLKICAVGDVHGSRYFNLFQASLKSMIWFKPDVCVFAGDMVDEGKVEDLEPIVHEVRMKFPNTPIVSVFGNEEYHELEDIFIRRYPEIVWLNDTPAILKINNINVGFIGTRGSLDKLTFWQKRNKPELELVYRERPKRLKNLINEVRRYAEVIVFISHYAPVFHTVKGEPERIYPYMGSRDMEKMIKETKPDVVIHAHAHNARVTETVVEGVKVFNVSLPARKNIAQIELKPRKTLTIYSNPINPSSSAEHIKELKQDL